MTTSEDFKPLLTLYVASDILFHHTCPGLIMKFNEEYLISCKVCGDSLAGHGKDILE